MGIRVKFQNSFTCLIGTYKPTIRQRAGRKGNEGEFFKENNRTGIGRRNSFNLPDYSHFIKGGTRRNNSERSRSDMWLRQTLQSSGWPGQRFLGCPDGEAARVSGTVKRWGMRISKNLKVFIMKCRLLHPDENKPGTPLNSMLYEPFMKDFSVFTMLE